MKNTLLALLALLGFTLLATPLAATAQGRFGYFTYTWTVDPCSGYVIGFTIGGYDGPGGAVTIPDTIPGWGGQPVTAIGNAAFAYKTTLTDITIPRSVDTIGRYAFSYCTNLTSVTIPGAVIPGDDLIIGDGAFLACTSLTTAMIGSYYWPFSGPVTIGDEAFRFCSRLTSVTVPGSITSIGGSAFAECYSLTGVTIHYGLVNIGSAAFSYCTSLTEATIPGSVTNIGDGVFSYCTNLISVTIPGSITSIGYAAFQQCHSLANITIPGSVTSIGDYAFEGCGSLKGVFFKGNPPGVGGPYALDGATNATVYYLPGATGWGATFAGRPTRLWNPLMQSSDPGFGVGPAGFGFNIIGTADIPIVVEACTNLVNAAWVPLQSLNLTNGLFYFADPNWTNYPARNYRIRSP